jgi:MFS family permease
VLFRFSLYGFLKNQRYFEPFLVLFFLDQGLSYTQIGLLVGVRELSANLLEIPSGAVADLYGRRRAMISSFVAYIVSFLVFALGHTLLHFAVAMFLYAFGDAFRTGTHKAMIFTWLRREGRLAEKTRVYGFTRSWSKLGSALSIVIATVVMVSLGEYRWIFYLSVVPYVLGIANFLFYPGWLDGNLDPDVSLAKVYRHLRTAFGSIFHTRHLRRLVAESMTFEGTFKVTKDYLQPIARQAALATPLLLTLNEKTRAPLLIGAVYLVLNLAASWASRNSHLLVKWRGDEERGVRVVWWGAFAVYLALVALLWWGRMGWAIVLFIALNLLQNLFRPMHISRFDAHADENQGATILSVESQSKSLAAMVLAPLLGWLVDQAAAGGASGGFWPLGVVGAVLAVGMIITDGHSDRAA